MAPRNAFIAVALVIALLGAAGAAAAQAGVAKPRAEDLPEHAKARGPTKHADPAPTAPPSAKTTEPTAPASELIVETRSSAATILDGATTIRPPGWAGDARATPASEDEGAPEWVALAWALPLVGVGGVVVLVAARLRAAPSAASGRSEASRPRMAPVSPFDLEGLLRNGQGAVSRGALAEAVAWFERALAISPQLGVAYFCKGVCLAANGEVADAYGALRSACAHAPEETTYRVHFARVAVALGKHKEAMDALEHVTSSSPELGSAMLDDPQLAGLRDHPRFLTICGAL